MEDYRKLMLYFSILKDQNINYIHIQYSGGGDNGDIDDIDYFNDPVNQDSISVTINEELESLFKYYCTEKILNNIEDWYNEDGGYGTITFNINDKSFIIENNCYRQEVDTYNHTGKLKLEL